MIRNIIATVLFSAGLLVNSTQASDFADISSHWAKDDIKKAVSNGFVEGYSDGSFKPDISVTRAEFIKMVSMALGLKAINTDGQWYTAYVTSLREAEIIDDEFTALDMSAPITRKEMAMIAVKCVDLKLTGSMLDAANMGLLHGASNVSMESDGTTSRAQSVTVIERILDLKAGKKIDVDKTAVSISEVEASGTNIKSLLNLEPIKLPAKIELYDSLETVIDKMIVVDMSDPQSAYHDWIPKLDNRASSFESQYVVALHFNIKNLAPKEGWDTFLLWPYIDVNFSYSYSVPHVIVPSQYNTPLSKQNYAKDMSVVQEWDEWFLVGLPKDYKKYDKYALTHYLSLRKTNMDGAFYLTQSGNVKDFILKNTTGLPGYVQKTQYADEQGKWAEEIDKWDFSDSSIVTAWKRDGVKNQFPRADTDFYYMEQNWGIGKTSKVIYFFDIPDLSKEEREEIINGLFENDPKSIDKWKSYVVPVYRKGWDLPS